MLCYKDMTFCASKDCANMDCPRNTRNEKSFHPDEFWKKRVCVADFSKDCKDYRKESK